MQRFLGNLSDYINVFDRSLTGSQVNWIIAVFIRSLQTTWETGQQPAKVSAVQLSALNQVVTGKRSCRVLMGKAVSLVLNDYLHICHQPIPGSKMNWKFALIVLNSQTKGIFINEESRVDTRVLDHQMKWQVSLSNQLLSDHFPKHPPTNQTDQIWLLPLIVLLGAL
jgi:hypothetical protein